MTGLPPRPNNASLDLDVDRSPRVRGLLPTRVLLVEDDYDAARLVHRRLAWSHLANFQVGWATRLDEGFGLLEAEAYDVMLLDLSLPGSRGVETLAAACVLAEELPIVILTGNDCDALAVEAVRNGAQDFLVKESQDGRTLARAILTAIERQRRLRRDPPARSAASA